MALGSLVRSECAQPVCAPEPESVYIVSDSPHKETRRLTSHPILTCIYVYTVLCLIRTALSQYRFCVYICKVVLRTDADGMIE